MTHVFHRHLRQTPPIAVGAQGMYIRDEQGREYLDASGGAAVSSLGHAHPEVMAAMHAQIDKLAYAHTSFFSSEPAEQLADELIGSAPEGCTTTGLGDDEYPVPMAEYLGADDRLHPLPPRPGRWAVWDGGEWIDPRTADDLASELVAARLASARDRCLAATPPAAAVRTSVR